MCREILNWCIRNTEKADARARSEGGLRGQKVWGMIEGSALARDVRKEESIKVSEIAVLCCLDGADAVDTAAHTIRGRDDLNSPVDQSRD